MTDMEATYESIEQFLSITRAMDICEEWDGCVCPTCIEQVGANLLRDIFENDDETDMGERVGSM